MVHFSKGHDGRYSAQHWGRATFTVKEGGTGEPFLMMEGFDGDIPPLEKYNIFFNLRPGLTYEDARTLANELNRLIHNIRCLEYIKPDEGQPEQPTD